MNNLLICEVCKKKFVKQGLKNHIINTAKAEAYKHMKNLLDLAKNKPYHFSPAVMLKQMSHFSFIRRNTKEYKKFDF